MVPVPLLKISDFLVTTTPFTRWVDVFHSRHVFDVVVSTDPSEDEKYMRNRGRRMGASWQQL